jgi:hypothetical protein
MLNSGNGVAQLECDVAKGKGVMAVGINPLRIWRMAKD